MQALVLRAPHDFAVEELAEPSPGDFEVLCRVERVGICGTDVHMIQGDYPMWPAYYPFTPGHEWSGQIVQLGAGAEDFGWAVGDRVAGTSHAPCGYCLRCLGGNYNLCLQYDNPALHSHYGHTKQGCYADLVVHSIRSIFRLPESVDFDAGAVADPASIALHCARRGEVDAGDVVAVFGAGPVGILAAEAARALGASRVIFLGRGPRVDVVRDLGYEAVDTESGDPVAAFRAMVPQGAHVVLDAAGTAVSVPVCLSILARGGRCATVGIPTADLSVDLSGLVLDELELVGCRAAAGEMAPALDMIGDGRMRAASLITHRFPLTDFREALEVTARRTDGALKVLIDMSL